MEIFDVSGQLVMSGSVNAGEHLDITALHNGVYTFRVIESNNVYILKFIKN